MAIEKQSTVEADILRLIYELLLDFKNYKALEALSLNASLSYDLGIGSLERVELMSRLERHFGVMLAANAVFSANLVEDLLPLLGVNNTSHPATHSAKVKVTKVASKRAAQQDLLDILKKCLITSLKILYSVYFFVVAAITILITWTAACLVPGRSRIFPFLAHYWARIFLFLVGCPLKITGRENIVMQGSALFIANHASYLDTIILCASIPREIVFVAKAELLKNWLLKPFFRKQRHILVERCNFSSAINVVDSIKKALESGYAVVIYPEATFVHTAGLRLFKLGAFKVAVETQLPLYPIAIKGARKLIDRHLLLQPGRIVVSVLPPLYPLDNSLAETVRLRDQARHLLAKESGEQLLNLAAGGFLGDDES